MYNFVDIIDWNLLKISNFDGIHQINDFQEIWFNID